MVVVNYDQIKIRDHNTSHTAVKYHQLDHVEKAATASLWRKRVRSINGCSMEIARTFLLYFCNSHIVKTNEDSYQEKHMIDHFSLDRYACGNIFDAEQQDNLKRETDKEW